MRKPNPVLSIIIPTYNAGKTLSTALDSIRSQTFQNLEIVIMDGMSKDDTLEIAKDYSSRFNDLIIVSEPDKGIYDAMNKGIKIARGDWLYFMGSDDSFYNSVILEKVFSLKSADEYDIIYGSVLSTRFEKPYDGEFSYYKLAVKNICHQAIFFKKRVFKKIGKFDLRYEIWSDWDHNIRWFYSSRINKLYFNEIVANYADGGVSSMEEDEVFLKDKNFKLLYHGFFKLPPAQRRDICNLALVQSQEEDQVFRSLLLKLVKFLLRIDKMFKNSFRK